MQVSTASPEYRYTITGLIEELERIRDEHGELPICIYDDMYGIIPLKSIWTQDGDNDLMTDTRVVLA